MEDVSLFFLLSLPSLRGQLNIIQRCASNYWQLGIFLLRDDDGSNIKRIEMANHYKPDDVMTEIFREWIASSQDLL